MRKVTLLIGLVLGIAVQALAQKANVIPTSANHPFTMENGLLNGSRASFKDDHHIDWMNNGDYATYLLDNIVDAQYFTVSFTAGTTQPNVTLNYSIKDANGVSVCNQDVKIENNGDWSSTARSYDFRTQQMLKGQYTMVITFKSVGGNGTTANVNNIKFTAKQKSDVELPQYHLTTACSPADAGQISVSPHATTFEEGDEVTISTTENFGYHFAGWQDASGNIVSTQNPYSFKIMSDTQLTAVFDRKNTYALNLTLTEGAQANLVSIEPAGTYVGGKRMYEEGTEVRLTAHNNKILTFIGWEDQTTNATRTIRMDSDQQLKAQFSAVDYIVGWDFYNDQPAQDRAADYKSDTENAGLLSLHNEQGNTIGWLSRGAGNGQENGRYAARIWKNRSEGFYFEISFSTRGYRNIRINSALGCSYNTYSVNNLQYSIDGKNYTTLATFNISGSGWFDKDDVALPADANEQQRVYVRWMPDRNSKLVGNATDYDGLAISNIFVTSEAGSATNEQALLVSSNPAEGALGVSSNGSIVLNFDKKIVAGTGTATLGDEQLVPIISGKSAVFQYSGLDYATNYTFHLPEGVLKSRSGLPVASTTIHFTTMERKQPAPKLYDAIVAKDGTGDFLTVQAAVNAAPAGRAKPYLIFIKNGRYKEHVNIPQNKPYLHFIGQDRDKTVILNDALSGGDTSVGTDAGATITVKANDIFFENLTIENEYGHTKRNGPQALALNTQGDRIALNHVRLLSYQDTWITTGTSNYRHYIRHSIIEGAVDFIYNSGNVFMDGDTLEINRPSGGFIVAPSHGNDVKWGYVFRDNVIRPVQGMTVSSIWLGRPWHNSPKTVYINTQLFVGVPAAGWYESMGGLPVLWADYNTTDANGNPVDLSQRRHTYYKTENGQRIYGEAKNFLTDEEAAQYTVKNVMGGTDNWLPTLLCEACQAPVPHFDNYQLVWQPIPYAISYVISRDGQVVGFTTDCTYEASTPGNYQVQAVNEYGGLSQKTAPVNTTDILTPSALNSQPSATQFYSLNGIPIGGLQKGLNILRYPDGSVKKVMR